MTALDTVRQNLQQHIDAYKAIKRDIQKNHQARQQLVQQKSENDMVLEELRRMPEDGNVFKLVGPALIKQDPLEAKANINKRLEYINSELERLDNQLKSMESKSNDRQEEIMRLQKKMHSLGQAQSHAQAQT